MTKRDKRAMKMLALIVFLVIPTAIGLALLFNDWFAVQPHDLQYRIVKWTAIVSIILTPLLVLYTIKSNKAHVREMQERHRKVIQSEIGKAFRAYPEIPEYQRVFMAMDAATTVLALKANDWEPLSEDEVQEGQAVTKTA